MSAHTPGPWSVSNGNLLRVTTTRSKPVVICGVHRIGKFGGHDSGGDPLANAYLIAEAPNMLALLRELIDIEGPQPGTSEWATKVHAAIAKAESAS